MNRPGPGGLGLDIGGTKLCAVVVDAHANVIRRHEAPTPAQDGPDAILDAGAALVREVSEGSSVNALGVGTAGVVDHRTGTIVSATSALPGWAGTDVRAGLSVRLGGCEVTVVNDVHAVAAAEGRWGAAARAGSYLTLAVGTGVGGAVVIDGKIVVGSRHLAGHLGHMIVPEAEGVRCPCGRTGHLEAVTGGPAMVAAYRALGGHARTGHDLARAVTLGDELARRVVRRGGEALGTAIASLAAALDPELVVVSGGALRIGDDLLDAARASVAARTLPGLTGLPVVRGTVQAAGAVGAACLVLDRSAPRPRSHHDLTVRPAPEATCSA